MFGDDSFEGIEDLFNQLAGSRRNSFHNSNTQSQNLLNTIESKGATTLVFDLSGKKVVSVKVKDNIETNEYGERIYGSQKVLTVEFENNEVLKYNLPSSVARSRIIHTFTNGILEVSFKK